VRRARITYGDPRDPATYPGVAAADSYIAFSGPLVKRIRVALAIRLRTGAPEADVRAAVQSAVAAVINRTGVGQPVAISDLVDAAASVTGVVSVSVVSPSYGPGSDLISVQPYEKPLVLSAAQDVSVSVL
jgi:Asp-tRNA(Asn)/Glu-tRNA(Gln) amidotransferase A subunit family amidase